MANPHVSALEQQLQGILAGLETVDLKRPTLEIGGALSPAEASAKAKSYLDLLHEVEVARADYQAKLQARNASIPDAKAFVANAKTGLVAVLGSDSPDLVLFGLNPKKPSRTLTPEERLARAAKLRQTRKLRGTLGKRQKAAVKATVDPTIDVSFPSTPGPTPPPGTGSASGARS